MGRFGEDTIYVKLRDGRGWVFENFRGNKVLERITLSSMGPPPAEPKEDAGDERDFDGGAEGFASPADSSGGSNSSNRIRKHSAHEEKG